MPESRRRLTGLPPLGVALADALSPSQAAKARPSTKPPPRAWPPRQGQKYSYEPKAPQSAANSTTASHLASVQAVAPTSQQRRQPYDVHSAKAARDCRLFAQCRRAHCRLAGSSGPETPDRAAACRGQAACRVRAHAHPGAARSREQASPAAGRRRRSRKLQRRAPLLRAQAQRGSEMDNGTASPRRERSFSMVALPSKGAGLSVGGAAAGVEAARSSSSTESAAGPFEAGLASAHGIAPTDDRLSAAASATDGGAGSASSSSSPPDAPQWLRVEALALELDLLNWVLGEGPSFSREDFWLDACLAEWGCSLQSASRGSFRRCSPRPGGRRSRVEPALLLLVVAVMVEIRRLQARPGVPLAGGRRAQPLRFRLLSCTHS